MFKKASNGDAASSNNNSYIDDLFFGSLPKTAKAVTKDNLVQEPISVGMEENGYIDQSYFQGSETCESLISGSAESVADCITDIREQLSINEYSGGKLDLKTRQKRHPKVRCDSQGFRIPDDDPIKFHLLTEDEVAGILYKCIIAVQENLIVLNKPPGIACHGGQGQRFSVDSLLPRLAYKLSSDSSERNETLRLTHRIDKEATGILLVSRNQDTHLKLTEAFAKRWIRKSYLCITSGIPCKMEGNICLPISEKDIGGIHRMVAHRPKSGSQNGSDILMDEEEEKTFQGMRKSTNAITHFNVLDRRNDTALVECCSVTGLRHQIRVHLSSALNTPILGDHKYSHFGYLAPQRLSNRTLEALGIRQSKARYLGLYLHAHSVKFGGVTATDIIPSSASPPPPGFFAFLERRQPREMRQFVAPVPTFFLATLKCLGMRLPRALRATRFKLF